MGCLLQGEEGLCLWDTSVGPSAPGCPAEGPAACSISADPGQRGQAPWDSQCHPVWAIPGVSWAGGEEEVPQPAVLFLNAGSSLNVCFQQTSRRSSSPEVWNPFSSEIYVSLPKGSAFLLGKMVLYDLPKQSQLHSMTQAGHRFGFTTDERIRKAQFEQLAHSQFCK